MLDVYMFACMIDEVISSMDNKIIICCDDLFIIDIDFHVILYPNQLILNICYTKQAPDGLSTMCSNNEKNPRV